MVFSMLSDGFSYFLDSGDIRVKDWPLVRNPLPGIAICLSYVLFVKKIGPALMADRKPMELRIPMMVYNLLMTIWSFMIFYWSGQIGWFSKYSYSCQPVDYTSRGMDAAIVSYLYYLTKFVEFTDTLFFVLRKKNNQISTLHVIHHGIMPMSVWFGMKYVPGGHATFFGFLNSLVHVPMYFYYFLAAFGPQMQKYLFWKKYLTAFQMVQFVAIFVHSAQLLFRPSCPFPKGFSLWILAHAILFWFLFSDFYNKTYNKKRIQQEQSYCKQNGTHKISNNNNGELDSNRKVL